ncbi:AP-1 complex subunit beta-1 [Saitoella complicata NRRL Y-17804]|nr:AP-1 complex subunit beta-1 [Saitoella complicata NRRL Y-17804]ODQ51433.1 AP-1 complex subunit beta-1 [Saitoella complicata NRRL Y-17804]
MAASRVMRAAGFAAPKKGETFELRSGLVSQYAHERKDAIQRTIAAMTLGKDVSALFPDVLKNIATHDLAQKKLVYLYLTNYAKSHPDLCILAVNTFVQDTSDPNPLVRALAIRTMGCIRVEKMVDYLSEPLRKTLKDESPYVRKTAAICVAKLFDLNPTMCIENGFLETLQEMLADANPMVVANAVTALSEIMETSPETQAFIMNSKVLTKLLVALNECSEWGRITILNALAGYTPTDIKEADHICERVTPQFQHANAAVVMAAVKVIMLSLDKVKPESALQLIKKMAPPLVTLVSSAPEVEYVALRNINLILQKQPDILSKEMRVFFCKYNDPEYVKLEKLEIMIKLANEKNVDQLLAELKEYASEVDVDFVRRAVRAIGQCAIKIDSASERCINVLLDLINSSTHKVPYVVQEAITVIKDIFRKYPSRYEAIIPTLCSSLDDLSEPNARASLIWIIGEYAEKISNADDLLSTFLEGFDNEGVQVQLQLLTATVKLFLKKPDSTQELVQRMLKTATNDCDNPDIRDRAYVYWRLLSSDPQVAKSVVLSEKPPLSTETKSLPAGLLNELIGEISSLASVYHKPKESFLGRGRFGADKLQKRAIEEQRALAREAPVEAALTKGGVENLLDFEGGMDSGETPISPTADPAMVAQILGPAVGEAGAGNLNDLLGLFGEDPAAGSSASGGFAGGIAAGLDGLSLEPSQAQPKKVNNEDILGLF